MFFFSRYDYLYFPLPRLLLYHEKSTSTSHSLQASDYTYNLEMEQQESFWPPSGAPKETQQVCASVSECARCS